LLEQYLTSAKGDGKRVKKQRREQNKRKCRRKRKRRKCWFTEIKIKEKRMEVFYDFAPFGLVNTCGGFKRAQCLNFRVKKILVGLLVPEEEGARMLRNIGKSVHVGKA